MFRAGNQWANWIVHAAYLGGVHLLGPLAGKVIRLAPPLIISLAEAAEAVELLRGVFRKT